MAKAKKAKKRTSAQKFNSLVVKVIKLEERLSCIDKHYCPMHYANHLRGMLDDKQDKRRKK